MPLAETTTPKIVLKKGELAKQQCEEAEKRLLQSELLPEERVPFTGDDAGFELKWLGEAPFMQARTGVGLFDGGVDEPLSPLATTVNPASLRLRSAINGSRLSDFRHSKDPLALSLHVNLCDRSFVSGLDKSNKLHLKVDVIFNGQLSSCLFVPIHDVRSGAKSLHQVFAGHRIDFLAERPWVILPPGKSADGSLSARRIDNNAAQRWEYICTALNEEAKERGMDADGNVPPSAEFLNALAAMAIPDEVKNMRIKGSRSFGVIDVIITGGDGRKVTTGTTYLKAPQRLADDNFPLRVSHDGKLEARPTLGDLEAEKGVHDLFEASPDVFDADAEGDSDPDFEPQAKRQAVVPRVLSMQPTSTGVSTAKSRNPFQDMEKPTLAALDLNTSKRSPTRTLRKGSSSGTSPMRREETLNDPSSPPERGRAGPQEYLEEAIGVSYGTPPSFYSFPSSSMNFARTPHRHPSPYSAHFSDPVLAHTSLSSLMDLTSFNDPRDLSSPLQHNHRNSYRAAPRHLLPRLSSGAQIAISHGRQVLPSNTTSMAWPDLPRRSSLGSIQALRPGFAGMQPLLESVRSGFVPSTVPVSIPFPDYGPPMSGSVPNPPPYDRRYSMALPPTGMYTVPTKPKSSRSSRTSLSPSKKSSEMKYDTPRGSFPLKRLVITGRMGTTLVDHRWPTAQKIPMTHQQPMPDHPPKRTSPDKSPGSSESSGHPESYVEPRRTSRSTVKTATSPTILPPQHEDRITIVRTNPDDVPSTSVISTIVGEPHDMRENGSMEDDQVAQYQPTAVATRAAKRLAMPQRRTPSGTNILGIQGPKATPFWLEDPEEVMREAARIRRSRSPAKRDITPSVTKQRANMPAGESTLRLCDRLTTSPLSSLATTPEPEEIPSQSVVRTTTDKFASSLLSHDLPQVDGSPERKSSPKKPTRTPSPTKLTSAIPPLSAKPSSPAKTSPSPNTKKRKAGQRYLVKQPRSPDRLKTVSNPPLNQDCVIAFAESEDKDADMGVLRQVKGERQGVFSEEYVVCAMRFYFGGE